MSTKTFKKEDIEAAVFQDTDEGSPLVLEHADKWIDEGKYQYQANILKETITGKFFRYRLSKSGSYFSDFTYSFKWEKSKLELTEVHKTTRTVEVWEATT